MGFERNYQIKVLSKQLKYRKEYFFFQTAYAQVQSTKLDPWFVTGFGTVKLFLTISIYKDRQNKGRSG